MAVALEKTAPIYQQDGTIDLEKISDILGFGGKLNFIEANIGITQRTLKRGNHSPKTVSALSPMIYMTNLLWSIFNEDPAEIKKFLSNPRSEWDGLCPTSLLSMGRSKGLIDFLERVNQGSEGLGS